MECICKSKGNLVSRYLNGVLPSCPHLLPQKVCPNGPVCCLQLLLCFCCPPLHPPLALQWSWWAFWLWKRLSGRTYQEWSVQWTQAGRRSQLNLQPPTKRQNIQRKSSRRHWAPVKKASDSNWSQHSPTLVFSSVFVVWSSVLYTQGESAASCTWDRPKSCSVFSLPPCSFPSLLPPLLQGYCPMWPSIYHMSRVPVAPPITPVPTLSLTPL